MGPLLWFGRHVKERTSSMKLVVDFGPSTGMSIRQRQHYYRARLPIPELSRTCYQIGDSMWNWTTNQADGDYRRMACHRRVSPKLFSTYTWSASPWGNKEFHLCRRWHMHHNPVPFRLTSRGHNLRGTGWTHRVLRKQQSGCQSWQNASHMVSSTEQRGKDNIESVMERSWSREHCSC